MSKNKNHTYFGKPIDVLDLTPGTKLNLIGNVALVNTSGLSLVITGLIIKEVALLVVKKEVMTPADLHLRSSKNGQRRFMVRVFWILAVWIWLILKLRFGFGIFLAEIHGIKLDQMLC